MTTNYALRALRLLGTKAVADSRAIIPPALICTTRAKRALGTDL